MSDCTDRELVQRSQSGDGHAVGELFSRYWGAARSAAFGVTGDFASAEDAAAGFLDVPAGTLRRRLHDGRARIRADLEKILQGSKRMNEEREHQLQRLKTLIDTGKIYQALRTSLAIRPAVADSFASRTPPALTPDVVQKLLQPSDRALDPAHPVGSIAADIRKALPDFEVRATRSIVCLGAGGSVQTSDVLDLTLTLAAPLELCSVQERPERLTASVLPGTQVRFSSRATVRRCKCGLGMSLFPGAMGVG